MSNIKWAENKLPKTDDKKSQIMSIEEVNRARRFHQSFPQYTQTPLIELKEMSKYLGLGAIKVKDESYRFSLNSFKVLGGSYSIAKYISQKIGKDISELHYEILTSKKLKEEFGQATFFTATDGNHGRGIAWAANKLGQKSVIFMPKGTTETRLKNIQSEGALATIEECNYDECVRMAAKAASEVKNSVVVQDTAWEGYEEIPSWIMQGYGTMALEADEQFGERPTHIFIQAGVGSLAGAIIGYYSNKYKDNPPIMIVVEALKAACFYKSALAGDGKMVKVEGDLDTIMAGLACGEGSSIAWDILKNHADYFIAAKDIVAARGMRMLAAPLKGDLQIISGESGAAAFGVLATIMLNNEYRDLRDKLKLDFNAKVLLFSTEGDTDPIRFKNIIWEAKEK